MCAQWLQYGNSVRNRRLAATCRTERLVVHSQWKACVLNQRRCCAVAAQRIGPLSRRAQIVQGSLQQIPQLTGQFYPSQTAKAMAYNISVPTVLRS